MAQSRDRATGREGEGTAQGTGHRVGGMDWGAGDRAGATGHMARDGQADRAGGRAKGEWHQGRAGRREQGRAALCHGFIRAPRHAPVCLPRTPIHHA